MSNSFKMIDEVFAQYNIDPNQPYSDKPLKPISRAMSEEILKDFFETHKKYRDIVINDKQLILIFESNKDAEEYSLFFVGSLISHINKYIKKIGEDPKDYYRVLSCERNVDKNKLIIKI